MKATTRKLIKSQRQANGEAYAREHKVTETEQAAIDAVSSIRAECGHWACFGDKQCAWEGIPS